MAIYAAESERLWLQTLNIEEHLESCFALDSSPEVMLWSRRQRVTNLQQTREMISDWLPTPEKPWNERWAIMLRPTSDVCPEKSKMIGMIGTPRPGELAYRLQPAYWGKGYMTEAIAMFLKVFWANEANKDFNSIKAGADPENMGSTRVLEKAGFKKSDLRKDFYERAVYAGVRTSDIQFFYLMRPSS